MRALFCTVQYSVWLNCSKQKARHGTKALQQQNVEVKNSKVTNVNGNVYYEEKKPEEHFFRKFADKRFYLALNNFFFVTHVTLHFSTFYIHTHKPSLFDMLFCFFYLARIVSIEFFFHQPTIAKEQPPQKSDKQAHFCAFFYVS